MTLLEIYLLLAVLILVAMIVRLLWILGGQPEFRDVDGNVIEPRERGHG